MPSPFRLEDYHDKNRLLLVFAASKKDPAYQEQCNQLAPEGDAFAERDLLLVCLLAEGNAGIVEPGGLGGEPKVVQPISEESAANLREQFEVASMAFNVILIGKDGTEKRRNDAPIDPAGLYADIDAMPMRQQEMRGGEGRK